MSAAKIEITFANGAWGMMASGDGFASGGSYETPTQIMQAIEEMLVEMTEPGTMAANVIARSKPINPN